MNRWQGKQRHVAAGQLLLLVTIVVVAVSLGFLRPSLSDWAAVSGIGTFLLLALLLSMRLPWKRLPDSVALVFPVLVMLGLAMTSQLTRPDIGNCYAGLFVLCFAYVGGFCRGVPRSSCYRWQFRHTLRPSGCGRTAP